MAQGSLKRRPSSAIGTARSSKSSSSGKASKQHKVLAPKKGARTIAPKKKVRKAQEAKDKEIRKRLTEGTERMLAEKAGRLEILGGAENRKGKPKGKNDGRAKKS